MRRARAAHGPEHGEVLLFEERALASERSASPEQQQRYMLAFREVLVTNITAKLGEYRGVKLTVQRARQQDRRTVYF